MDAKKKQSVRVQVHQHLALQQPLDNFQALALLLWCQHLKGRHRLEVRLCGGMRGSHPQNTTCPHVIGKRSRPRKRVQRRRQHVLGKGVLKLQP